MSILELDCKNKSIMIFGDLHAPYHHEKALRFLEVVRDHYKPDLVICNGDEVDAHGISMHETDPDLPSAGLELDLACAVMAQVRDLFPRLRLTTSNHGSLIWRRAKKEGIPKHYLRPLSEVYATPNWTWHDEIILKTGKGDVYLHHGKTAAYGKLCKEMGMSSIQSHFHGKFEVCWYRSPTDMRFNAFTGCLVDENSLAMAYGRNHLQKPILGCLLIDDRGIPHMIKML